MIPIIPRVRLLALTLAVLAAAAAWWHYQRQGDEVDALRATVGGLRGDLERARAAEGELRAAVARERAAHDDKQRRIAALARRVAQAERDRERLEREDQDARAWFDARIPDGVYARRLRRATGTDTAGGDPDLPAGGVHGADPAAGARRPDAPRS